MSRDARIRTTAIAVGVSGGVARPPVGRAASMPAKWSDVKAESEPER
jgi:hypothetical protein